MSEWRYGMRLAEHDGPGGTARGFSREGCINMLGHDMAALHHGTGDCTCGQYRKDRLKRPVDERKRCQPCRDLDAAKQALNTQQEVTYLGRIFHYRKESIS
jgi:hypothetical protein